MTQDEFESLVRRLEQEAVANPAAYRRKLGALALLGYGYILAVLLLLTAGVALFVWLAILYPAVLLVLKKVGWALGALIYVVFRAMWVQMAPPQGRPLSRSQYPQLFAVIDELRAKAKAPRVHDVLLTDDFNAAVVQHPRFGILGGVRNHLILGLPLMQALSPEELKAVVAHELGHLSGAHGRFGAWIYRLRVGWTRLLHALQQNEHWGSALFTRFFGWYAPLFHAYSFVQARQQEYEADRMSMAAVGAQPAASALLRVNVQGDFIGETFWPAVLKRADKEPAPNVSPFAMLGSALKQQTPVGMAQRWLGKSLSRRTSYDDTHPCLADRLKAMGVKPHVPPPITVNSAEALLGQEAQTLQQEMDERWRAGVQKWWEERHQYATNARSQLAELDQRAAAGSPLAEEEQWARARLTEELASAAAALPLYEALLERNSQHVGALWRHGSLLLDRDDARGIDQVLAAARLNTELELPACAAIIHFHRRTGRDTEARQLEQRYWHLEEKAEVARRERNVVRPTDRFLPHELEGEILTTLMVDLGNVEGLRRAWLVRKKLPQGSNEPLYVLGILPNTPWWKPESSGAAAGLTERISRQCRLPGETLIISVRANKAFLESFKKARDSEIFSAE